MKNKKNNVERKSQSIVLLPSASDMSDKAQSVLENLMLAYSNVGTRDMSSKPRKLYKEISELASIGLRSMCWYPSVEIADACASYAASHLSSSYDKKNQDLYHYMMDMIDMFLEFPMFDMSGEFLSQEDLEDITVYGKREALITEKMGVPSAKTRDAIVKMHSKYFSTFESIVSELFDKGYKLSLADSVDDNHGIIEVSTKTTENEQEPENDDDVKNVGQDKSHEVAEGDGSESEERKYVEEPAAKAIVVDPRDVWIHGLKIEW